MKRIDIEDSTFDRLHSDSFSTLKSLEYLGYFNTHVNFEAPSERNSLERMPLSEFKELRFYLSYVTRLSKDDLRDFSAVEKLVIDNCEIIDFHSDVFDNLVNIKQLIIKSSSLEDFDFTKIVRLKTLKYLALHDVYTNNKIDYNLYKELPNLETILFDTLAYKDLDFENFPSLKLVEVGLGNTQESEKLKPNAVSNPIQTRIESLRAKGIQNKFVQAGKDSIVELRHF